MKRVVSLLVGLTLILSLVAPSAFALDGVWHEPYGNNCIYDIGETERTPRNPAEGENVIVKGTTWPIEHDYRQEIWYMPSCIAADSSCGFPCPYCRHKRKLHLCKQIRRHRF